MSIILETLGITATDIKRVEQQQQEHEKDVTALKKKWSSWLKEYEQQAKNQRITVMLRKNLLTTSTETISATQKALNKTVAWSSSRYNENKKADVVKSILKDIAAIDPDTIKIGPQFTTGCFSEGAHSYGENSFNATFSSEGSYRLYCVYGSPYLLIEGMGIVLFEGFNYPPHPFLFPYDAEIETKYQEYENEMNHLTSSIF